MPNFACTETGWWISAAPASVVEGDEIVFKVERTLADFAWGFVEVTGTGAVLGNVRGMIRPPGQPEGIWYLLFNWEGTSKTIHVQTHPNGATGEQHRETNEELHRRRSSGGDDGVRGTRPSTSGH